MVVSDCPSLEGGGVSYGWIGVTLGLVAEAAGYVGLTEYGLHGRVILRHQQQTPWEGEDNQSCDLWRLSCDYSIVVIL